MKRNLLLVVAVFLIVIGLFLLVQVAQKVRPSGQGALQVTANLTSDVYLDDKLIGKTPVCKCDQNDTVTQGEYTIRIVPEDTQYSPFVVKAKIEPGVLTAIERTFLPGSLASAYVLTLEKTPGKDPQLFVGTLPDSAMVMVDSTPRGSTPFLMDDISPSEHEIEIQKEGFAKKTIRVNAEPEYKLIVSAYLGTESNTEDTTSTLEKVTPTPQPSPEESEDEETPSQQVEINNTPVGFLRVRSSPSTAGNQITTVEPGEIFTYTDEQNGWYKITLTDGTSGWVSGTYVTEVTQ